ncbi:MAG: NAD(P)(+) transhydrogenase (Re/Si-specific) subunit beta [Clostridia bacterium]|nr:NAD(P)(+) transhydrogenase (Re/Si-specific) subunit beta [Clostridia bacterium]
MGNFSLDPSITNGAFYYIISAVLVILVMVGINMMSKVSSSVKGNLLGAGAMLGAIVLTLWNFKIFTAKELYIAMLIGGLIGVVISRKTKMIQMPQMVALLNGFGGLASMIAGILTLILHNDNNVFANVTSGLAIFVGGLTFLGSAIAAGKLQRIIKQKPVVFKGHAIFTGICLAVAVVSTIMFAFPPFNVPGTAQTILILVDILASNLFGYFFAIRVGGADMPITISLLNSCSGVAGAIAGLAISDLLLVSIGAIVGASGLLLTQIMCNAMHRKLFDILLGKTSAACSVKPGEKQETKGAPVEPVESEKVEEVVSENPQDIAAEFINEAKNIIIVPGYGMALSQAQPLVKQLTQELEQEGKNIEFAIHPVAGRMPGHMNVLLAEVDIPYEKLHEMDEIDDKFKETDLAIVIGANDVINPAANTAECTPIYGMPVLSVNEAKHVLILNYDLQPGYAGVENPLYKEAQQSNEHVVLLLGDAKDSLTEIKKARSVSPEEKAAARANVQAGSDEDTLHSWFDEAKNIIIVPGYGMALSQAQPLVKQLTQEFEQNGKNVEFAIHPVAGRMPGHMNVLLAEVDIPYEKLHEMDEIDCKFKETDLAIVIGANDVINPAANTAEGTPIYGMPVLSVNEAKHVLILNYDLQPGYAGVDNPLYEEANKSNNHVILSLGDAKENIQKLFKYF